jgi:hypothetical protein
MLKEDQALVMEGTLPACKFAGVVLWNRFLQSYDYVSGRASLNRNQMMLTLTHDGTADDGGAHADVGMVLVFGLHPLCCCACGRGLIPMHLLA